MADETPKTSPGPAKSGKKKLFLILGVIVIALASAAGWYVMKPEPEPDPAAEAKAKAEAEAKEMLPDTAKKKLERQTKKQFENSIKEQAAAAAVKLERGQIPGGILVPLTRQHVAYQARNWERYKRGETHRIMVAKLGRHSDRLTVPAHPDRIVVNLAEATGNAVLVLDIQMLITRLNTIPKINERNHRLFDRLITVISKKTQIEANRAGFKEKLQAELLREINQILGYRTVSDLFFVRYRLN